VHLPLSRELLYTEITTQQQIENTSVDPQHPDLTLLDCSYRCSSRVIELSLFKPSLTLISSSLSSASSLLLAVFITSLLLSRSAYLCTRFAVLFKMLSRLACSCRQRKHTKGLPHCHLVVSSISHVRPSSITAFSIHATKNEESPV
jgi:hypothetical protein